MEESGKGEAAHVAFEAFDVNPVAFRQYIPQVWWCLWLSFCLYSACCVHTLGHTVAIFLFLTENVMDDFNLSPTDNTVSHICKF